MDVEVVQLGRAVLDDPVLDIALPDDDIRDVRLRVERLWRLAVDREKECGGAVRVVRILLSLGKEQFSDAHGCDIPGPWLHRRWQRFGVRGQCRLRLGRAGRSPDCDERAVGIIFAGRSGVDRAGHQQRRHVERRSFDDELDAGARRHADVVDPLDCG